MGVLVVSILHTQHADKMMRDANTILLRLCFNRVCSGYCPCQQEYLHHACCDVSDLLKEISSWLTQWPAVMAALAVAAEGTHLHKGILDFSYAPNLAKHVCELFTFKVSTRLHKFNCEGEWMNVQEAMDMLLPIVMEAREMVEALLKGLPEIYG